MTFLSSKLIAGILASSILLNGAEALKAKSVELELQTHFSNDRFPNDYPTGVVDGNLEFPIFGKVAVVVHAADTKLFEEGELTPEYLKAFLVSNLHHFIVEKSSRGWPHVPVSPPLSNLLSFLLRSNYTNCCQIQIIDW